MLNLFNLTLRLNGFPIKKSQEELDKILALSEEDYATFLELKKKEIVAYHLQNNPFYSSLIGSKSIGKWEDIPVMKKIHLQKPLVERLSKGFTRKNGCSS